MATQKKRKPTKSTSKKSSAASKGWKKKLLIWSVKGLIAGIAAAAVFILFVYLGLFGRIPSKTTLSKIHNHTASEVYSLDGKLMGRYYVEHRLSIENALISKHVLNALVATEDSRFFEHNGLDFISLGRVIVRTIIFGDKAQGGGSTISQQLAKNLFPRKRLGFLTLPVGKTKEMFIAARLEELYSKDDILTLYLNTVPFGEDIYGIEVASQRFFGVKSKDLNPAEAATLVGMLAANTAYNPRLHPEKSTKRRNIVLGRMHEQNFLSENEMLKWQQAKMQLRYYKIDHNTGISPYFRERIRVQALQILADKYGDEYDLYSDGLRLFTTIDARLQAYADKAVAQQMSRLQDVFERHWKGREPWEKHPRIYVDALRNSRRYKLLKEAGWSEEKIFAQMDKKVTMSIFTHEGEKVVSMSPADSVKHYLKLLNVGFVAMNPQNGHVLAWVGGIDHKTFQFDHVTSNRQVGSTFKPIVYATALEEGTEPCEFISNEQLTYPEYDNWNPANSNGNHEGFYSVKGGLANSVNTISARLITRVGVGDVVDMAEKMGIEKSIPNYPSIALGTADLSLLDMVSAYTTFPNYGRPVKPIMLLRIEDKDGNVLYQNEDEQTSGQVYNEDVAHCMVDMLKAVVNEGTAGSLRSLFHLNSELGGKTGTTQDNSDGWFIGFTPNLVAGAWVGNDQPAIHFRTTALGSGGHTALPIFARFMQQVENDGSLSEYYASRFYPVPYELQERLACDAYSLDDPDTNLFDRFIDSFGSPDSSALKRREERQARREEKQRDHKSVIEKMKDLFRRK